MVNPETFFSNLALHTLGRLCGAPMGTGALPGMDALSTPGGLPARWTAPGKAAAKNAGDLAIRMLALATPELAVTIRKARDCRRPAMVEHTAALRR